MGRGHGQLHGAAPAGGDLSGVPRPDRARCADCIDFFGRPVLYLGVGCRCNTCTSVDVDGCTAPGRRFRRRHHPGASPVPTQNSNSCGFTARRTGRCHGNRVGRMKVSRHIRRWCFTSFVLGDVVHSIFTVLDHDKSCIICKRCSSSTSGQDADEALMKRTSTFTENYPFTTK